LSYKQMADTTNTQERSATDNIRELSEASKQLFEAGKQLTDNLAELSDRVEHASEVGSNLLKSPWLIVGGSVLAGLLLITLAKK